MTIPTWDPSSTICGAATSSSTGASPCKLPPGYGTSHPGTGRCWHHDGQTILGKAKFLLHLVSDPDLIKAAEAYMEDPALTSPRSELALLKAELSMLQRDTEELSHIPRMLSLCREIGKLSKIIHEIEVGKRHYIHVNVVSQIVAAYGEIGRRYLPDEAIRGQFSKDVQEAIRNSLQRSAARAIAANVIVQGEPMVIDAQPEVVTVAPMVIEEDQTYLEASPVPEESIDDLLTESDRWGKKIEGKATRRPKTVEGEAC